MLALITNMQYISSQITMPQFSPIRTTTTNVKCLILVVGGGGQCKKTIMNGFILTGKEVRAELSSKGVYSSENCKVLHIVSSLAGVTRTGPLRRKRTALQDIIYNSDVRITGHRHSVLVPGSSGLTTFQRQTMSTCFFVRICQKKNDNQMARNSIFKRRLCRQQRSRTLDL